MADFQRIW